MSRYDFEEAVAKVVGKEMAFEYRWMIEGVWNNGHEPQVAIDCVMNCHRIEMAALMNFIMGEK